MTPAADLSSGMPADRERVVASAPGIPLWAENFMFALYDPALDLGMMFHLGTRPDDWTMWHDQAYLLLPPALLPDEGGIGWMWAYHRTAPGRRPAGSNLAFRCLEPFRRWEVTFDGYMLLTPNREMTEGLAREGRHHRVTVSLEAEMLTPAWDLEAAAHVGTARGSMASQGWASEHYQQLYRATGTVTVGSDRAAFTGYGWRDHSRGPRGGQGSAWGGHVTTGAVYPDSGRAWSFSRYWTPEGTISLEAGYVVDGDGRLHQARIVEAPRLRHLILAGEELPVSLEWDGGSLTTSVTTRRSLWMAMTRNLAVGLDLTGPGLMYSISHGPASWDGEAGTVYVERSDFQNAFPEQLRHRED